MPEDEYVERFGNMTLNYLRSTFERTQNFKTTPQWIIQKYNAGHFRRIKARDVPTAIKLKDGGIVGYRLPAHLVMSDLSHVTPLEEWASRYQHKLPRAKDTSRGVHCVRRYASWIKYRRNSEVGFSSEYTKDGEISANFIEASQLLWKRAGHCFPKHHHLRIIKELNLGSTLDDNHRPLCGPWMGCAVNVAVDNKPVETTPHRDLMGFFEGMSCLCPFGEFRKGGLVLWELNAVVELRRGDLFFFMDHLINHSNEKAYGQRHSVVAFTEDKVWTNIQKKYHFKDLRSECRKARRYRRQKAVKADSCL